MIFSDVLTAFGLRGEPVRLPGGQGQTWRVGNTVLKPCGMPAETIWVADTLSALQETSRFRVARPMRAQDGAWIAMGWQAWLFTPGEPDPRRWHDVLDAGHAFHEALQGLPRPSFLDEREDPWTIGERIAWQELPLTGNEVMAELMMPLAELLAPVSLPSQPVHGDLLGNVMFADGLAPAVIDWPVYYRPVAWAHAVAVVDAVTWHAARPDILADHADQMLLRALLYRIATNEGRRRMGLPVRESAAGYQQVANLVSNLSRARRR